MSEKNKFVISFPSETELVMEREFNAPRRQMALYPDR